MHCQSISFEEALALTLASLHPLPPEKRRLDACLGAAAAGDIYARVAVPSAAAALRDGYAVRSADIAAASKARPVKLALTGLAQAGARDRARVGAGAAVRILTGGRIPLGADAVVAEEDTRRESGHVVIETAVEAGHQILSEGADLAAGELVVTAGERLTPGRLGLLAAAGLARVRVHRKLRVAIIATGDELRLPGSTLQPGQLYAGNAVTLDAWCRRWHCTTTREVLPDRGDAILAALQKAVATCDVVLTSGGAWSGERDLVWPALEMSGVRTVFQRVRMTPGKGTGLGLVHGCPVFVLSGGPPANLAGFLKLALPALLKMGGHLESDLPQQRLRLQGTVRGGRDGTRFVFGRLRSDGDGAAWFQVDRQASRLKTIGRAQALLTVPEGTGRIPSGTRVAVSMLA